MSFDRAATLRSAEKLLRQGKLDQAIDEYRRVVEEAPQDWNTANVLGDLLVRAGKLDKAIEQFVAAADSLSDEGGLAKAAALYRKILKLRPEHEHALLQCAEIAATQGLLVDARTYLKAVADRRQARGDQRGVAQVTIRLASLDSNDFAARRAGARARLDVKDLAGAVRDLREIAVELMHQHREADAIDALREAVALAPDDHDVRQQLLDAFVAAGDHVSAREHARTSEQLQMLAARFEERGAHDEAMALLREALAIDPANVRLQARVNGVEPTPEPEAPVFVAPAAPDDEDPADLLIQADRFVRGGHVGHGLAAIRGVLKRAPHLRTDVALLGLTFTDTEPDVAFAILDLAGDASIAQGDWAMAAAGMQELVTRVPAYLPALMRLVEICVDGGLEATMHAAQAQLCDAYIDSGAAEEARFLAEDLVAREPWERANLERFRRALELLGEPDPDAVIERRLSGESPFTSTDVSVSAVQPEVPAPLPPDPTPGPPVQWQIDNHNFEFEATTFDASDAARPVDDQGEETDDAEVDLSVALEDWQSGGSELSTSPSEAPATATGASLEDVFSRLRSSESRQAALAGAEAAYVQAVSLHADGRVEESIPLLTSAADMPQVRFGAASLLGRIYRERGELEPAAAWLERASQAPPPTPDEGRLLLYDLADVLEASGEYTRALTVCMELQADAGAYRDVAERVRRLAAVQMRG